MECIAFFDTLDVLFLITVKLLYRLHLVYLSAKGKYACYLEESFGMNKDLLLSLF